jgi:hypothetical protein
VTDDMAGGVRIMVGLEIKNKKNQAHALAFPPECSFFFFFLFS